MLSWRDAYNRTVLESKDFRLLFGKSYAIDEFRYYAYALKFESLKPALLATDAGHPNTGDKTVTVAAIDAPTTNLVPGEASASLLDFPAGAIVLGITSAAILPQRVVSGAAFTYGPSRNPGSRDLYVVNMEFVDTSDIVSGNPIPEISLNADSATNTAPPILADALMGSGSQDIMPARELIVTPGLGILTTIQSMVLPNAPSTAFQQDPNLTVHVVFHCMVPGNVRLKKAA